MGGDCKLLTLGQALLHYFEQSAVQSHVNFFTKNVFTCFAHSDVDFIATVWLTFNIMYYALAGR